MALRMFASLGTDCHSDRPTPGKGGRSGKAVKLQRVGFFPAAMLLSWMLLRGKTAPLLRLGSHEFTALVLNGRRDLALHESLVDGSRSSPAVLDHTVHPSLPLPRQPRAT